MAEEGKSGPGQNPNSKATRFPKGGSSPNPKGRPLGSKNRNSTIRAVLGQLVGGDVDGQKKKITITEASLLKLSQKALSGHLPSIKLVLSLWKGAEDALAADREAEYPFKEAVDRQVIDEIYARMKASEA